MVAFRNGKNPYQTAAVMTASPGQLVVMLYDGVLKFVSVARAGCALPENDPQRLPMVQEGVKRSLAIIDELRSTLDKEKGGEYAESLDRLYDYYSRRLLKAQISLDDAPLAEVEKLVETLRGGWVEMLSAQARV
jgi:flagellar secretion chaperone FliS